MDKFYYDDEENDYNDDSESLRDSILRNHDPESIREALIALKCKFNLFALQQTELLEVSLYLNHMELV